MTSPEQEIQVAIHSEETGAPLVVTFHGAVKPGRSVRRALMGSHLDPCLRASVVTVIDPSLSCRLSAPTSWYAAKLDKFSAQVAVLARLRELIDRLQPSRVVFVGGSSGGFAAAYFASQIPGSAAVAVNPQLSLPIYWATHALPDSFPEGVRACWPGVDSVRDLGEAVCLDVVPALKASGTMFAYVQNSRDMMHLRTQLPHLLGGGLASEQLLVDIRFHGVLGHSGSIPLATYTAWVEAVIQAPSMDADGVAMSWSALSCKHSVYRP